MDRPAIRYALAAVAVGGGMLLRWLLSLWVGPGLPTYVTFYPAVMLAAVLGGLRAGLAATFMAAAVTDYWLLPPEGWSFWQLHLMEAVGLVLFLAMGTFMSLVAELFRRSRQGAAALEKEVALRQGEALRAAEREREQEKLRQLNRTLKAHARSDQAILRAADEPGYLREVCRVIVEECGHAMVWVGLAENDEAKTVRPVAWAGLEEGYLQTLKITWADTERGRGPTGTAIRTGQVCTCRNMLTDPLFEPWRENALRRGYASSIVLPLMDDGKAYGALTIYSREPDPFSAEEVQLLTELAGDFSHGIGVLRLRAAHAAAEQELRQNERRLRTILDALPVAIFLSDAAGNVVFTNQAVDRIWGLSTHVSRDQYGQYKGWWRDTGKPVEPEQWALARTLDTGEPFTNDPVEIDGPGGARRIIHNFAIPIQGEGGSLRGAVVVTEDITERVRAEEDSRRTAEELARSNHDLEQFAYVSSHDLQEPLRMVTGFMQLFEQKYAGKIDETADRYIHYAVDGAKRMRLLIEDLLAYSRVGAKGTEPAPVDSGEVLRGVLAGLGPSIEESRAQVTSGKLPTVRADATQLAQVFQNLIGNAIKFRGDQPPVVRVDARRDGDRWVFSAADNGIGIDPAFGERIFVIFQRLHTKEKYPGTGIGLAICKKIVERHGGRIWVESKAGQGSTFYFTIPA